MDTIIKKTQILLEKHGYYYQKNMDIGYYGTRKTHGYYTIENTWLPLEKYGD